MEQSSVTAPLHSVTSRRSCDDSVFQQHQEAKHVVPQHQEVQCRQPQGLYATILLTGGTEFRDTRDKLSFVNMLFSVEVILVLIKPSRRTIR